MGKHLETEDLRSEYDFSGGVRGKYAARMADGQNLDSRRIEILREMAEDWIQRSIQYEELRKRESELETATLRGHLFLEELLNELIEAFLPNPAALKDLRLGFYEKVRLAQAMTSESPEHEDWALLLALNGLRNDLAHQIDSRKRPRMIGRMRKLFAPKATPQRLPDAQLVVGVVDQCMRFLALRIREAAAARRWAELLGTPTAGSVSP